MKVDLCCGSKEPARIVMKSTLRRLLRFQIVVLLVLNIYIAAQ
jgi:hypothetical protein